MTNEIKLMLDLTQFEQNIARIDSMVKRSHKIWENVDNAIPELEQRLELIVRQKINEVIHEHESRRKEIVRLQVKTRKLDKDLAEKEAEKNILNAEILVLKKNKREAANR